MTPRTAAPQAPLSVAFPRQEYWCGLPFPPPGALSHVKLNNISRPLPGLFLLPSTPFSQLFHHWFLLFIQGSVLEDISLSILLKDAFHLTLIPPNYFHHLHCFYKEVDICNYDSGELKTGEGESEYINHFCYHTFLFSSVITTDSIYQLKASLLFIKLFFRVFSELEEFLFSLGPCPLPQTLWVPWKDSQLWGGLSGLHSPVHTASFC